MKEKGKTDGYTTKGKDLDEILEDLTYAAIKKERRSRKNMKPKVEKKEKHNGIGVFDEKNVSKSLGAEALEKGKDPYEMEDVTLTRDEIDDLYSRAKDIKAEIDENPSYDIDGLNKPKTDTFEEEMKEFSSFFNGKFDPEKKYKNKKTGKVIVIDGYIDGIVYVRGVGGSIDGKKIKHISREEFENFMKDYEKEEKITKEIFEQKYAGLSEKIFFNNDNEEGKWIYISKNFDIKKGVEVLRGNDSSKRKQERKVSKSVFVKDLKKLEKMLSEYAYPETVTSKKTEKPSSMEIMEAKLDELKKMLLSKEAELKEYREKGGEAGKAEELKKEIEGIKEEIEESGEYFDVSRKGAEITLNRLRNETLDLEGKPIGGFTELNADTAKKGDEKFKEKTRELWKDLVVHGSLKYNEEKKEFSIIENGDLDVKCCLGLMKQAGINTDYVEYVEQGKFVKGKINIDTGNKEGIILENDGTVFMDHHDPNSPRNTSATERVYQMLVSMGMIEENEKNQKMVDFINESENGVYRNLDSYYDNSWRTFKGLANFAEYKNIVKFFNENSNPDPYRELSDQELIDYGFKYKKKEKKDKDGKVIKKESLHNYCDIVKKNVMDAHKMLDNLKKEGFIIESEKYGKIVVDIGGRVKGGFFASRAFGANTYINWNPELKSFFISSEKVIEEDLPQGLKIRGTMIIKPRKNDAEPIKITLEEALQIMTGKEKLKEILEEKNGEELIHRKLIDFFEQEIEDKKIERIGEEEDAKKKKEEDIKNGKGINGKISFAEKDLLEAEENYKVARMSRKIRAHGVSLYNDLLPGDDYSIRIKVAKEEYEGRKAEFARLQEIAKDPEKIKQFEKEEAERENKTRKSEIEERLEKNREALDLARREYMEMSNKKKIMWNSVRKFFGNAIEKEKEQKEKRDGDVEYFRKEYEEKLSEFKKAMADYIQNSGFEGDEIRKSLQRGREIIALREAIKFYAGNADARFEMNEKNNNNWELIRKESLLLKLPDKFGNLAERIDNWFLNVKEIKKSSAEEKTERERKEKEERQTKEIEELVEEKNRSAEKEKKEKEIIDKISSKTAPKEIVLDIMLKISDKNNKIWKGIKDKTVREAMNDDKGVEKRTKNIIESCEKVFGNEAVYRNMETMKEYVQRITEMIIKKNKK